MSQLPASFMIPPAQMGFVGFMRPIGIGVDTILRVTSGTLNQMQTVDAPDVIDGTYNRTIYQLGAFEVGGSVSFPAIFGTSGGTCLSPAGAFLGKAVFRNSSGLLDNFSSNMKYTSDNASFLYHNLIVNSYTMNIAREESVTVDLDLIGTHRTADTYIPSATDTPVARVVRWNDAYARISEASSTGGAITEGNNIVSSASVRNFTFTLANNANRYYTLNGSLYPQAVAPTKIDLNGEFRIMGRIPGLSDHALTNVDRCSETWTVIFGYSASAEGCCGNVEVKLPNCVFQIEQMELTNDLLETSVAYRSFPANNDQLILNMTGI